MHPRCALGLPATISSTDTHDPLPRPTPGRPTVTTDRAAISSSGGSAEGRGPKLGEAGRRVSTTQSSSIAVTLPALPEGSRRGRLRALLANVRGPFARPRREAPPSEAELREARARGVEQLPESVRELWAQYVLEGSEAARNGLVCAYQGLVKEIAGRFASRLPRSVERTDLENAGSLGLISAIASFEPERGIRFEAFAEVRIRGALLDELRTQDWLPRPFRRRFERRKRVVEKLRRDLAREPHDDEIASALGVEAEEYQNLFGVGLPGLGSTVGPPSAQPEWPRALDGVQDDRGISPDERIGDEELLAMIAESLTEQEFRVLYLRYWQDKPLREIGEDLALSESRVSKIHARMIERLNERFATFA